MSQPRSIFSSLSTLLGTLLGIAQTRLELLTNEIEEQKTHLLRLFFYSMFMLFFFGLGIIFLTLLIIALFWDTHRLLVVGLVAASYLGIALAFAIAAFVQIRNKPKLFSISLNELKKDCTALDSKQ